MATPRVTIDQLPEQAAAEDTNFVIVQDEGITKKMSMATLKNVTSTPLANHIAAITDAHDATAISATASGPGVDSTTVQGQLGQLALMADAALTQTEADARYVNLTGDTLTGPLYASGAPVVDLEFATKKYVDDSIAASSEGITQAEADALYVNVSGDTVTGALSVEGGLAAGSLPITSVGAAVASTDAVNKGQADGLYVAKAGSTMTGLLVLSANPSAALGAATKQYVDGLAAATVLDPKYVNIGGDSMTGALKILSGTEQLALGRGDGSNNPHLGFYKSDMVTRMGYIQYIDGTSLRLHTSQPSTSIEFLTDSALRAWIGASRMSVAVPLYCDTQTRLGPNSLMWAAGGQAMLSFYANGTDALNIGASDGYVGENGGNFQLRKQSAGNLQLWVNAGDITFNPGGTEQGRWLQSGGHLLVGKTGADNYVSDGCQFQVNGVISSTTDTASTHNLWVNHISGMDANGMIFATFRRTTSGTQIGSITQTSTTGVAFNQTSDKRLKTFTRNVDDDEALEKMQAIEPVHFIWNDAPDDGEQIGFFAQDLQAVVPEAVVEGVGEPGDEGFIPWGMDNSKLVPYLVSAVQALGRRLVAYKVRIEELEEHVRR